MQKIALLTLLFCVPILGFGQKTEYSVQVNSGLFRFGGESATKTSDLILGSGQPGINYTHNPYGKKVGLCYGLAAQVQKVNSKNFIYGLQAGYETLRSKVALKYAYSLVNYAMPIQVSGKTILRHNFINANPFVGKRFVLNNISLDFNAGLDFGYCLKSHEKGKATDNNGQTYTSDRERDKPGLDTRGRLGLAAYYHQIGFTAGYSVGLKNYTPALEGLNRANYARLIRFGLAYRI